MITGQKPLVTRAKKSIAQFKLREGSAIGAKVTLRGDRMWEFLDRLISLSIPASATSGLPRSFDGRGNYTFGVTEQLIFPRSTTTRSTTSGHGHHHRHHRPYRRRGKALLDAFGPFRREGSSNGQTKARRRQSGAPKPKVRGHRAAGAVAAAARAVYRKFGPPAASACASSPTPADPGLTKASW